MDPILLITIFLVSLSILFISLSIFFYKNNYDIKHKSNESVMGKVVSYSRTDIRVPRVEYFVKGKKYKQTLRYSYIVRQSTPFTSTKTFAKDDLLSKKLRLNKNRLVSFNNVFQTKWPIASSVRVYYNPKNPKIAYVERFAPTYYWVLFFGLAIIMLFVSVLSRL